MLINTITLGTGSGGVLGVNEFDHHACESSFVLDKASELVECPRVLLSPLALPNRDSGKNPLKILKGDSPSSAFSLFNNPLADCVVDIRGEALFLSGAFSDKPQGCFGAFGLELGSQFGMSIAKTVQMPARINRPIGVRRYIHYTEVYAQKAIRLIGLRLRGINHHCEVKGAIIENEVGLSHLPINPRFLICPYSDGDSLPTFEGKNRDLVQPLPGEDALVIDHRRVGLEGVPGLPIRLVTLRDLGYRPHSHLRRKFVVLAKMVVGEMVKVILPECATLKRNLGCVIAGFVKPLHRLKERLVLLLVGRQLDHQSLFHAIIVDHIVLHVKYFLKGGWRIPPLAKAGGFPRRS